MNPDQQLSIYNILKDSGKLDTLTEKEQKRMIDTLTGSGYYTIQKKQSNDDYYYYNKDTIKKDRNIQIVCNVCGEIVKKGNISSHKNSKTCILRGENKTLTEENEVLKKENERLRSILDKLIN